jgi:hypothetical protein
MPDEKKIIIDEDWKARVQAEKMEAAKSKSAAEPGLQEPFDAADVPMPPASFELLLTTLTTEALMALGQVPHPVTGKAEVRPNHAKYLIDTVEMLRQKTKGNLTPGEQQAIDSLLHQLRMLFVAAAAQTSGQSEET